MKTLLIIGGGVEQAPAYEIAKNRGLIVVATDADVNAPALKLADHVILASTRDADETVKKVLQFSKKHKIDGVMTIANDVPYTVARVADELHLPSISVKAATLFSDKLLMKEAFVKNGVACPWFCDIENIEQFEEIVQDRLKQKYVLKPVDGRGARGVLVIDENVDLPWAFNESMHYGESGRLILEKFVEGVQLSTESFLFDGVCYTPSISERNYLRFDQFKPNIIEDGGTIPAKLSIDLLKKIDDLILHGAKALGVNHGLIKGDIVINRDGEPEIIELAARISGGWFASHQILSASGVNLVDIVISYALGENIDHADLLPKYNKGNAIRYWFPEPGIIKSITGESELKKIPGLLKYGFFRKKGDVQPDIKMHSDRFGYVIVEGKDRCEAISRVENAISCLTIEVE
jgi:biotin carboxylase